MPSKSPVLGSLAVQAPSLTPLVVHVSASTCHNLSLFKGQTSTATHVIVCPLTRRPDLLKEYRRLDDSILMRLNRTDAQFRDRDRLGAAGKGSVQDQSCIYMWKELVGTFLLIDSVSQCNEFPQRTGDAEPRSCSTVWV
jgi:hypothetical protein